MQITVSNTITIENPSLEVMKVTTPKLLGNAVKHGINLANCVAVIDSDYRGELMVPLKNNSDIPFEVHVGDRIAQLLIQPVEYPIIRVCNELETSKRGTGGFGSTGV